MAELSGCLCLIVIWALSIPINGLLISLTWGWFVVPIFGAPRIGIIEAIGLSIFLSVIMPPVSGKSFDFGDEDDTGRLIWKGVALAIFKVFVAPLSTAIWASIWHVFFMPTTL